MKKTPQEADNVVSHRFSRLAKKLGEKAYRDNYVSSHLRIFLTNQIRALRGEMSQAEFGKFIQKPQSVVSRLEDPHYGKLTLQTLLDIANKLDVALLVRFTDYPTFLNFTDDFSDDAINPSPYDQTSVDLLASDYTTGFQIFRTDATQSTQMTTESRSERIGGISTPNIDVANIGTPIFALQSITA